jgi:hypothetical protein
MYMYDIYMYIAHLMSSTYWDAMFHEDGWREGSDEMVEEIRLVLKQLWSLLFHDSLQGLSIGGWYSIPGLRLTPGEVEIRCYYQATFKCTFIEPFRGKLICT